ncbi:hypothetical protein [Pseudovibrio sp. JE062]|uniref:hypothetical protein n=1 Tax=Pseudovibrio sp. JE062 TaxID=439495 RepID=UPI000186C269|nr:hypothetical protein [Pseudovibrio sp. JE062]EEA96155.1 hypothetical protein PJE062_991 [Pseudovibrio sp. JE062]
MIATSGYLHLPYELGEDENGIVELTAPAQAEKYSKISGDIGILYRDLSFTAGLLKSAHRIEAVKPRGSGSMSVERQLALQYGTELARTRVLPKDHSFEYSQRAVQTVNRLRDAEHLYLKYSAQFDLSRWFAYEKPSLTFSDETRVGLEMFSVGSSSPTDLHELIAKIENRYHLLQRLYTQLPRLSEHKRRPGYAYAFMLLTDGVLSALRAALAKQDATTGDDGPA